MKSFVFILLIPFSFLYAGGVILRNWLFDRGVLKSKKLPIPVISIGNIASGGTGKTPLVEYIGRLLHQQGHRVAVLSRGYKRSTKGYYLVSDGSNMYGNSKSVGDEPVQLGRSIPGCIVAVDENRVRGGERLVKDFSVEVIVLDDGFQHRWLHRDLDIVLSDCITPAHYHFILPAGRRREPLRGLKRADILIVTKCNDERKYRSIVTIAKKYTVPHSFHARRSVIDCRDVNAGTLISVSDLKGKKIYCFSGIAYPEDFLHTIEELGGKIVGKKYFSDHYRYSQVDIDEVLQDAHKHEANLIMTTEKDAARLDGILLRNQETLKIYALRIALKFSAEEESLLQKKILEIINMKKNN